MSYSIGQFHKAAGATSGSMTLITSGVPKRIKNNISSNIEDEAIYISSGFEINNNYFFHGWIRTATTEQNIKVRLCKTGGNSVLSVGNQQYIKTINIPSSTTNQWYEVYFVFNVYDSDFDAIKFELDRNVADQGQPRHLTIIYEELSLINNYIQTIKSNINSFKQINIRANSGFSSCINGEEIKIGKSNSFILSDDDFTISFYSPIVSATELTSILDTTKEELIDADDSSLISTCIFNSTKTRTINEYTIDYIYEE